MKLEIDHVFVCVEPGAPEADELVRFGLREGEPNTHPGQGSACRRFPFANSMIELFWVSDPVEAQGPSTRRTLLWERWSGRRSDASPFGICLRPADKLRSNAAPGTARGPVAKPPAPDPFPGWAYRPSYLAEPHAFHIGNAGIDEPMWVCLSFMRRQNREAQFLDHPNGIREITSIVLNTPAPLRSDAARIVIKNGVLSSQPGKESLLEIEFDQRSQRRTHDFRPSLPLLFHF